jgi:hypothetical protein
MTRLVSRAWRKVGDSKGTSLVEAAIITPLLLLLTFAIVDFGALFYVYLALENGVSLATRFAITGNTLSDPGGTALGRTDSIKLAMRRATPTLTIDDGDFTFEHIVPGGAGWVGGVGGPSDVEKVSVNYKWTILTPVIRPFFPGGQMTFHVESAMKNEGRFE